MERTGPLVPSVHCVLVIADYLEAYSTMRGDGEREKRKHSQNNLCENELTDINSLALLGIFPSHSTTELRVEKTFPENLFFSCTFCGEGETIIEKKKGKNRRWKGQPCTITASSALAPFLNCTNTASAWPHTGDACQRAVEHSWAEIPFRDPQSQARSTLRAGLCWAHWAGVGTPPIPLLPHR